MTLVFPLCLPFASLGSSIRVIGLAFYTKVHFLPEILGSLGFSDTALSYVSSSHSGLWFSVSLVAFLLLDVLP